MKERYRDLFQTNPCGIEATTPGTAAGRQSCFRRTLVGLKLLDDPLDEPPELCFRRTLVGLKLCWQRWDQDCSDRFRRTLVGLKRVRE